jgi:DNA-binding response OmpR family regulator
VILVVDDDIDLRSVVRGALEREGFAVDEAGDGDIALTKIATLSPELVVLDLCLPTVTGLDVLRAVGSRDDSTPVIVLTGLGDETDRIVGLELGADDYLAKPCELRELLARIRSVLRRSVPAPVSEAVAPRRQPLVRFGTKWLDLHAQLLRDDRGNEFPLAGSEFALLKVFAENPKRVLSREQLLDLANARDREAFDRAIDVRITRLRRKIEPDPAHPSVIRTVRGAGYLFSPSDTEAA